MAEWLIKELCPFFVLLNSAFTNSSVTYVQIPSQSLSSELMEEVQYKDLDPIFQVIILKDKLELFKTFLGLNMEKTHVLCRLSLVVELDLLYFSQVLIPQALSTINFYDAFSSWQKLKSL